MMSRTSSPEMRKKYTLESGQTVRLYIGDIAEHQAQVIVNAANSWLVTGGGVSGAIFSKAGKEFTRQCDLQQYCPVGDASHTLLVPDKDNRLWENGVEMVIHAVSPVWYSARLTIIEMLTMQMYASVYEECVQCGYDHIAIPAIGTGAYNVPTHVAATLAVKSLLIAGEKYRYPQYGSQSLRTIDFVLYDVTSFHVYNSIFGEALNHDKQ